MTPAAAAALWEEYIAPYKGKVTLVGPSVTNGAAPMGIAWYQEFLAAVKTQPDAVQAHWYDSASNTAYFESYMEKFHDTLKLPMWITEFGGSGTDAEQEA